MTSVSKGVGIPVKLLHEAEGHIVTVGWVGLRAPLLAKDLASSQHADLLAAPVGTALAGYVGVRAGAGLCYFRGYVILAVVGCAAHVRPLHCCLQLQHMLLRTI